MRFWLFLEHVGAIRTQLTPTPKEGLVDLVPELAAAGDISAALRTLRADKFRPPRRIFYPSCGPQWASIIATRACIYVM